MKSLKLLSVIGGRPQFIKEAVMQKAFKASGIQEILVNSGQHYDYQMSDVFVDTLGMSTPDYNYSHSDDCSDYDRFGKNTYEGRSACRSGIR